MTQCPFCMQERRGLGAILVFTAAAYRNPEALPVAGGQCCDECLQLIALMLDNWTNGGINNFKAKLIQHNIIQFMQRN